jgi:hypothetical protein
MRNFWRASDKSEKVPLIVLGVCLLILVAVLAFRPFY